MTISANAVEVGRKAVGDNTFQSNTFFAAAEGDTIPIAAAILRDTSAPVFTPNDSDGSGLRLTFMGQLAGLDGETLGIFRIRNYDDAPEAVILDQTSGGDTLIPVTIPGNTEAFVAIDISEISSGSFRLRVKDGSFVDTDPTNTTQITPADGSPEALLAADPGTPVIQDLSGGAGRPILQTTIGQLATDAGDFVNVFRIRNVTDNSETLILEQFRGVGELAAVNVPSMREAFVAVENSGTFRLFETARTGGTASLNSNAFDQDIDIPVETLSISDLLAADPDTPVTEPFTDNDKLDLRLTSVGQLQTHDGETVGVFRARNSTDEDELVTLKVSGDPSQTQTFILKANTQTFIAVDIKGSGTTTILLDEPEEDISAAIEEDDDTIPGADGDDPAGVNRIEDTEGDDVLTGSEGSDAFLVINGGNDVITDFSVDEGDDLSIRKGVARAQEIEDGVLITFDLESSLLLQGLSVEDASIALGLPEGLFERLEEPEEDIAAAIEADDGTLRGTDDDDVLTGTSENDRIEALGGDDILTGGAGSDIFVLTGGNDIITDFSILENDDLLITRGVALAQETEDGVLLTFDFESSLLLQGLSVEDAAIALGLPEDEFERLDEPEEDTSSAIEEDDGPIVGTDDNDDIEGTSGDDEINGDPDVFTNNPNAGDDIINGGEGSDTIHGGAGDDVINGGGAGDVIDVPEEVFGVAEVALGDIIFGDFGDDTITGTEGLDALDGGDGNDIIKGLAGPDGIEGGNGDDQLFGGAGNDILNGEAGNDVLDGGADDDTLDGGTGADTFIFSGGNDVIEDFSIGEGDILKVSEGFELGNALVTEVTGETPGILVTFDSNNSLFLEGLSADDALTLGLKIKTDKNKQEKPAQKEQSPSEAETPPSPVTQERTQEDNNTQEVEAESPVNNSVVFNIAGKENWETGEDKSGDADTVILDGDINVRGTTSFAGIEILQTNGNTINGFGGKDSIDLSDLNEIDGVVTINGGAGGDDITGSLSGDIINGGHGSDDLFGGDGNDILNGGTGNDTLEGGEGNDVLDGGSGKGDSLFGGAGDDILHVGGDERNLTINGGSGTDTLVLDEDIRLSGTERFAGIEYIQTNGFSINGAGGKDTIDLSNLTVVDEDGDIIEDEGVILNGGAGGDTLTGTSGDDEIAGGHGSDNIFGGDGNDELIGGTGSDTLDGGDGDDILDAGSGNNQTLIGGRGDDTFILGGQSQGLTLSGGANEDTVILVSDLTRVGNLSFTGIETLFIQGDSQINGNGGANIIDLSDIETVTGTVIVNGGSGGDTLIGSQADDQLNGGHGSDTIDGGDGNDILTGGRGRDTFIFSGGQDSIEDFEVNRDTLAFEGFDINDATSIRDTDAGLLIEFDTENSLTLTGIIADDLGFSNSNNLVLGNGAEENLFLEEDTSLDTFIFESESDFTAIETNVLPGAASHVSENVTFDDGLDLAELLFITNNGNLFNQDPNNGGVIIGVESAGEGLTKFTLGEDTIIVEDKLIDDSMPSLEFDPMFGPILIF